MRVKCIKRHTRNNLGLNNVPGPDVGDEVTVVGEQEFYDRLYFRLEEYYEFKGKRLWFDAKNFAVPSDLDETELVTEEFKEKYHVPA